MNLRPVQHAQAMALAVVQLLKLWKADDEAACHILALGGHRYSQWKEGVFDRIDDDTSLRLVILIRIYVSLRTIFTDPDQGHRWMDQPNAIFQGQRPLDVLVRGDLDSLRRVREYLEAEAWG